LAYYTNWSFKTANTDFKIFESVSKNAPEKSFFQKTSEKDLKIKTLKFACISANKFVTEQFKTHFSDLEISQKFCIFVKNVFQS
jgi:hypothetical protein